MPRVQFTGPIAAAPPGVLLFQPDEVREVGERQAAYLCRNAQFHRVADQAPSGTPESPAPAVAAESPAMTAQPHVDEAPFILEG